MIPRYFGQWMIYLFVRNLAVDVLLVKWVFSRRLQDWDFWLRGNRLISSVLSLPAVPHLYVQEENMRLKST